MRTYMRRLAEVKAEQLTESGLLETEAGIFKYSPGDWLIVANGVMWICEADQFEDLYIETEAG